MPPDSFCCNLALANDRRVDRKKDILLAKDEIVLITIGSPLRGDDAVAQVLCDGLPMALLSQIKRYDLELKTQMIGDCIQGAKATVILDASKSGAEPGTATILDLHPILKNSQELPINSCHSLSFVDELKILSRQKQELPALLIFFGIEVLDAGWQEGLSSELRSRLPELQEKLIHLLQSILNLTTNQTQAQK